MASTVVLLENFFVSVEILNVIGIDMKLPVRPTSRRRRRHYNQKAIVKFRESLVINEKYFSMKEIVNQSDASFLR